MRMPSFVGKFATLAVAMAVAVGAETARAETKTWRGTTSSANVATNWDPEGVPQNGDAIVLNASSRDYPMTWDVDNVTVGSWTQDGYTNVVTFMTGTPGLSTRPLAFQQSMASRRRMARANSARAAT